MEKLVGQEIRCKITKLDVDKDDVVVDRRVVLEQEEKERREAALASIQEGQVIQGTVKTLMDFGAFIDIGGIDGLLHVTDMSWTRVNKPSDLLKPGEQVEVKVLKVNPENRKISLGMKQLQPDPWAVAPQKFQSRRRVHGTVARLTDFGAFINLAPGVDGLVHISEMSWSKKIRKPSDVVSVGDTVEVVVLGVNPGEKRISLGLKQALGDPWEEAEKKYPVGSIVEGPITNMTNFGAFVDLGGGVEGMIHVGDITREKRLEHPREVLQTGAHRQGSGDRVRSLEAPHPPGNEATGADQHRPLHGRAPGRRNGNGSCCRGKGRSRQSGTRRWRVRHLQTGVDGDPGDSRNRKQPPGGCVGCDRNAGREVERRRARRSGQQDSGKGCRQGWADPDVQDLESGPAAEADSARTRLNLSP